MYAEISHSKSHTPQNRTENSTFVDVHIKYMVSMQMHVLHICGSMLSMDYSENNPYTYIYR